MVFALTGGERHEQRVLPVLMEQGAVKRRGQGLQQSHDPALPQGAEDRGSHSDEGGEAADPAYDRNAYRERNVVERLINRLKQWRRIATRYEKRAAN